MSDLKELESVGQTENRRKGKVARLPKPIRDRVNHMLTDGIEYAQIIKQLGPEGEHLKEENIGTWRAGGYQDWLRDQARIEEYRSRLDTATDLIASKGNATFQEATRQIASAQLCDLLLNYDATAIAAGLAEKPELYPRLLTVLARISEGELACSRFQTQEQLLRARLARETNDNAPGVVQQDTLKQIAKDLSLL